MLKERWGKAEETEMISANTAGDGKEQLRKVTELKQCVQGVIL